MRKLKDKHEIYYHMLEVAYTHVALERGHVRIIFSRSIFKCENADDSLAQQLQGKLGWTCENSWLRSFCIHCTSSHFIGSRPMVTPAGAPEAHRECLD
jgi:hypothetical protein